MEPDLLQVDSMHAALVGDTSLVNRSDVHKGDRRLQQSGYGGSVIVTLSIEYLKENMDMGNKTMKVTHLFKALAHPDFLRRFQEQMREQDKPVVVTWTQ